MAQGASKGSVVREQSGNLAGSRWGLKGSEDLGGGYKAVMTLEGGFNSDTGTLGQGGGSSVARLSLVSPRRPVR